MALLYVVSGLVIILLHITSLPDVILNIVTEPLDFARCSQVQPEA